MSELRPPGFIQKTNLWHDLGRVVTLLGNPSPKGRYTARLGLDMSYIPEETMQRFPPDITDLESRCGLHIIAETDTDRRKAVACDLLFRRYVEPDDLEDVNHHRWTVTYSLAQKTKPQTTDFWQLGVSLQGSRVHAPPPTIRLFWEHEAGTNPKDVLTHVNALRLSPPPDFPDSQGTEYPSITPTEVHDLCASLQAINTAGIVTLDGIMRDVFGKP